MNHDPRDVLWDAVFETYYDAYQTELIADSLVSSWEKFDVISTMTIAVTATGSAVTSWALWDEPGFRGVWTSLVGLAGLLAIASSVLKVPDKIKSYEHTQTLFTEVRFDLETLRHKMNIDAEFDVDATDSEYLQLREKYKKAKEGSPFPISLAGRRAGKIQAQLDVKLADEIDSN